MQDCIRKCISEETDLFIDNFDDVTFEDICAIIHYITKTGKIIMANDGIRELPEYTSVMNNQMVVVRSEELAIFMFLVIHPVVFTAPITTLYLPNENGVHPRYHMSARFVDAAKRCGVYDYPVTKHIITAFDIKYEVSYDESNSFIRHYMNPSKSAMTNQ